MGIMIQVANNPFIYYKLNIFILQINLINVKQKLKYFNFRPVTAFSANQKQFNKNRT